MLSDRGERNRRRHHYAHFKENGELSVSKIEQSSIGENWGHYTLTHSTKDISQPIETAMMWGVQQGDEKSARPPEGGCGPSGFEKITCWHTMAPDIAFALKERAGTRFQGYFLGNTAAGENATTVWKDSSITWWRQDWL